MPTKKAQTHATPDEPAKVRTSLHTIWIHRSLVIAAISLAAIACSLVLEFAAHTGAIIFNIPLWMAMLCCLPLFYDIAKKMLSKNFGADFLGVVSIATSVILGQYLAGAIIVLMLSGGQALETFAMGRASSVLAALSRRMPSQAHKQQAGGVVDLEVAQVAVGDIVLVYPNELCPVDGIVLSGTGTMDESYLTGEPFRIAKTSGSTVISGAINGEYMLTIQCSRAASDSRYAKIMAVMRESEAHKPQLRRLGDRIGAIYTPVAIVLAVLAWIASADAMRFLSVLVIATPCPLLLGIPIAIIGSISRCARRSIIVKSAAALEQVTDCRTAIFDKTGTLTYGKPVLTEQIALSTFEPQKALAYAASLERYSKHPLAQAIIAAAEKQKCAVVQAKQVSEKPGEGLGGVVDGIAVRITSREKAESSAGQTLDKIQLLPDGLECVCLVQGVVVALFRFSDAPRIETKPFIRHLAPKHGFTRLIIVSGDRKESVAHVAQSVGITEIYAEKSPEEKLTIVRAETAAAKTLYVGDGINDAPAMMAATVGVALGTNSDITSEAAGIVILNGSLKSLDECMHISQRMRTIALQCAVGGMALSVVGMIFAAAGQISPVQGAVLQEIIDVLSVFNALRAAFVPRAPHKHRSTKTMSKTTEA